MPGLAPSDIFVFEDFRLDRRGGLFRRDDNGAFVPVAIGSRALDILRVLIEQVGDVVSKEEIITAVWPETVVEDSNLTVQISALRRVLDRGRGSGSCIQTVAGRGYRFVATMTHQSAEAPPASIWASSATSIHHPVVAPRLSIVVLPFTILSNEPNQQHVADGITEDLTSDLSRIAFSSVISCNTAFTYRNKAADTKKIGSELGVRYVIEGSVRRAGSRVRVNVQLIDAETDVHLWAERYDSDVSELLALQDDITGRIAASLDAELVTAEATRQIDRPDALDYILRGRAAMRNPPSRQNYAEAIAFFERALALDPRSVEAQSALAFALGARVLDQMVEPATANVPYAEMLVDKALRESPRNAFAHLAKGAVLRALNRAEEASIECEMASVLRRNWAATLSQLGWCKLLTGSLEDAITLQERALHLSPRDPGNSGHCLGIGAVHLLQSRTDEAVLWFERARNTNPTLPHTRSYLAAAYALEGDAKAASAELDAARKLRGQEFHSSIARRKSLVYFGVPAVVAQFDDTFFAGLRKAGVPEE
jgi:TolB-like protein/Flp pilus assembly protein TadD